MCCCGIENLKGFKGNTYNICHLINNKDYEITDSMRVENSANIIGRTYQTTLGKLKFEGQSFVEGMKNEYTIKKDVYNKMFGKS